MKKWIIIVLALIIFNSAVYAEKESGLGLVNDELDKVSIQQKIKLSAEEQAWIAEHPEITLGFTAQIEPLLIVGEDGQLSGILKDIYDEVESAIGIKINIEIGEWLSTIQKAKDGEIDGLLVSASSLAKDAGLIHSHILTTGFPTVFAKTDAPFEINSENDLEGKKIAVLKGVYVVKQTLKPYEGAMEIIETESALEMMKMVLEGKVDAAYGLSYHNYLIGKYTLIGIEPVYFSHKIDANAVASVRAEWPEFISIMNKVLEDIGRAHLNKINRKWTQTEEKILLTDEEMAWVDANPVINMCVDPDWMPFEQINDEGEYEGLIADYMNLFSNRIGIRFELYPTESYNESIPKLIVGECSILTSWGPVEGITDPGLPTKPYYIVSRAFAVHRNAPFVSGFHEIADRRIGVVLDYPIQKVLLHLYPAIDLVTVKNQDEGLLKVSNGEIDAFAGSLGAITYSIQQQGLTNVKIGGIVPGEAPITLLVNKKEKAMVHIFEKVIDSITREDHKRIADRWISIRFERGFDYTLLWKILVVVTIVFALFLYWNRRLSREVKARQRAEVKLQKAKEVAETAKEAAVTANQAKSIFLANMSHEIRTPMNAVLGFAEILKREETDERKIHFIENIYSGGKALLSLINDILDLSKVEAGKLELQYSAVSIDQLLTEIKIIFEHKIYYQGLEFIIEKLNDVPQLLILDETRVRQIFINLLSNAVKFTNSGFIKLSVSAIKTKNTTRNLVNLNITRLRIVGLEYLKTNAKRSSMLLNRQKDRRLKSMAVLDLD